MEKRKARWNRGAGIGRGSFGTVSLAVNRSNGRVFAVKSVNVESSVASAVQALENEIEMVRSLDSPYVVRYLGDDRTEEAPGVEYRNLHLEYVCGGTVADAAARGELDERVVRSYTRSVLRALEYLHSRGVVHCDVKGRNVLVGPSGTKLADFGSARRVASGGVEDGWLRGTPLWMAPEVVRGEAPEPAADVWSLGCTLIEMATGKVPWSEWGDCAALNATEAMCRIGFLDLSPKLPSRLSVTGLDFLEKCLKRDACERWTCEQLLQHPFVDCTPAIEQSPRSVLDGIEPEFHDDEDEDSDPGSCNCSSSDQNSLITAIDRIAQLACKGKIDWESDGWEVVRGPPQISGSEQEDGGNDRRGESEEMRLEYSSGCSGKRSEGDCCECGYVSFADGSSCAESCSCCYCCCCRAGFRCQHGWGEKDMGGFIKKFMTVGTLKRSFSLLPHIFSLDLGKNHLRDG
ncbi:mitogen-activated protein kinase kinase kinase 17-like [Aristolochia californica]|uniref:mitogen-activated protein kinase kinase kinase 17-like n=1 Tax=Aristolochia californica TaxID=171875 RepID=UPI0035D79826